MLKTSYWKLEIPGIHDLLPHITLSEEAKEVIGYNPYSVWDNRTKYWMHSTLESNLVRLLGYYGMVRVLPNPQGIELVKLCEGFVLPELGIIERQTLGHIKGADLTVKVKNLSPYEEALLQGLEGADREIGAHLVAHSTLQISGQPFKVGELL